MRISEFNTVVFGKHEYEFSKFIKLFNDDSLRWIEYDQVENQFTVYFDDEEYELLLPENVNKNILEKLMQIVNRHKIYEEKLRVRKQVRETGAFPSSKTDVAYYKESLKEDLHNAKINLASSGFLSSLPFAFAGLTVWGVTNMFDPSSLSIWPFFGASGGISGTILTLFGLPYGFKGDLEKYKLIKNKLKALKEHEK
jgi:hypothetical protein